MFVRMKKIIILMIVTCFLISFWTDNTFAAEEIAKFSGVKGEVRIKSRFRAKGKWLRVKKAGVVLFNGDEVKTLVGGAELTFNDGSIMKISENSSLSIEERPTKKKLFGFIDMSYMNRNIKIAFGKVWANVKKAKGLWTSFESRVAVAGIKGTTVSMYVDSRGDMQFSDKEGSVEIAKHDGSFVLKMESGRDVWIKAEEDDKTLIQSVSGSMKVYSDDVDIQLGNKNAIILGVSGNATTVETTDYSEGAVKVVASAVNIQLEAGKSVRIDSDRIRNELRILTLESSIADITLKITSTKITLDPGEEVLIKLDETNETATVTIVQTKDGIYILMEDGRTYNLGSGDKMELATWVIEDVIKTEPQPDPIVVPDIVEPGPASNVIP